MGSNLRTATLLVFLLFMADLDAMEISPFDPKEGCYGYSIGECYNSEDEMANRRYISYDALLPDRVPCPKKGNSYYNCGISKEANPYKRPCTKITHSERHTY